MAKFYLYFSACFGTFWLVLLALSIIKHSHENAGEKGLIAALVISFLFGIYKSAKK